MSGLVGSTPTLVLALCLLVLVGSLPALPTTPVASRLRALLPSLLALASLLATSTALWLLLERPGTLPNTFPGQIAKYAATELNAAKEPTVLIVDGGSYVLNAVDCDDLMDELGKLGHPTHAVRLAAGAANHFERFRLQQRVVERLQRPRPGQRWLFLAEVQQDYDNNPLAQYLENVDTERTFDYSTLSNAWFAAAALGSPGVTSPPAWRWKLSRNTLINSFSAGALLRMSAEADLEPGGGRVSKRGRQNFKFRGLRAQLGSLLHTEPPERLPWLQDIREARIRRLWQPFTQELVFFGVPSTRPNQLAYVRGFCNGKPQPCVAPEDPELLQQLDDADNWRDPSHMSKAGATLYTRWLARQLVSRGLVK